MLSALINTTLDYRMKNASKKQAVQREDSPALRIYTVLSAVPKGRVITYGTLARLAGMPRGARLAGTVLHHLPKGSTLPWHRVINHAGKISLTGAGYAQQKKKLLAEGIAFSASDKIDLKKFGWPQDNA